MDLKKYRIAIGALVLAALLGLSVWIVDTRTGDSPVSQQEEAVKLPKVDKDKVTALEIKTPDAEQSVHLARLGDTWKVTQPIEAEADTSAIETALEKLGELEVTGTATERAKHHERLEVDEGQGVRVIAKAGDKTTADLIVGAYRSGNTMVRQTGKEPVVMVKGSIKYAFNKPLKDWRDRRVVDIDSAKVQEVSFASENGSFRFVREGDEWKSDMKPKALKKVLPRFDSSKVQSVVSSLSRMRALDFAAAEVTAASAGLGEGAPRVTLLTSGEMQSDSTDPKAEGEKTEEPPAAAPSQKVVLRLGSKVADDREDRYLQKEGDDVIYVVSSFLAERVEADADAFQQEQEDADSADDEDAEADAVTAAHEAADVPPEVMKQIQEQLRQAQ